MPDKLPDPPATANGEYFDAALRHQIGVRRLTQQEVNQIILILEKSDAELASMLRARLGPFKSPNSFKTKRWARLIQSIRSQRDDVMKQMRLALKEDLVELASIESKFEVNMIQGSLPVQVSMAAVPKETLRALVTSKPFSGGPGASRTLGQWWAGVRKADQDRIVQALQMGITQGETIDQMVRRVVGTRARKYTDGILALTRRQAEAVVRTGVNHVSNAAREQVWIENDDIIAGFKWVSTLDGRTSPVCRSRDGQIAAVPGKEAQLPPGIPRLDPPGARPPAHPNCRSVVVAFIDGEEFGKAGGDRPFVRDTSTRKGREIDHRANAKKKAGSRWGSMTQSQRNAAVRRERTAWGERVVGRVPNDTTYNEWLKRQPADFQDDVLGKARGKLFRNGGLSMDQFVDSAGRQLNLKELAAQNPTAFMKAGLGE